MPSILATGRIIAGATLKFVKLNSPYLDVRLALDYVDDLPLFMRRAPADHAITFDSKAKQPRLFESP